MQMNQKTNDPAVKAAANYLIERNVPFVFPESSRKETDEGVFLSFLSPEALNPNLVVDPPDTCLLVNPKTLEVELIFQL